jgi:hypothetical protein
MSRSVSAHVDSVDSIGSSVKEMSSCLVKGIHCLPPVVGTRYLSQVAGDVYMGSGAGEDVMPGPGW